MSRATVSMRWDHPRLGRIHELLCDTHEKAVLGALKTLGVGCTGERYSGNDGCARCVAVALDMPAREYVQMTATTEGNR